MSEPEIKLCRDCQQMFPVDVFGCLKVPFIPPVTCDRCGKPLRIEYHEDRVSYGCQGHGGGSSSLWLGHSSTYCPTCHEERRKKNSQVYPRCPLCSTPTLRVDFLRKYQGYCLDRIKVCCKRCIPQFEALSEDEQVETVRRAMVKEYGETAVIYALQYDDTFPYQHIGRTKHLKRRMAEYRRKWEREIKTYHVLEEIPFGPLSVEREIRWFLHALKRGWPIDNFDLLIMGKDGLGGRRLQAQLFKGVQSFEPLTAPYEIVAPLIRQMTNTRDADITHWLLRGA